MRRRLEQQGFGADHGFRCRGGDISRLEGLSDAVFAFAVTLLMLVYGAGFIAVQLVFILLYLRQAFATSPRA